MGGVLPIQGGRRILHWNYIMGPTRVRILRAPSIKIQPTLWTIVNHPVNKACFGAQRYVGSMSFALVRHVSYHHSWVKYDLVKDGPILNA